MKRFIAGKLSLSGLAILLLFISACGGGEEEPVMMLECGEGTYLENGQCVVDDFGCAEGLVPNPQGRCLDPAVFCGSSATYDSGTGECLPVGERIECGEGTFRIEGRCLPESTLSCGDGTVLADGECRLRSSVCGAGTTLTETECLPNQNACSGATEFDVITRECVHTSAVVCGEGTVDSNNRCIPFSSFVDQLAADADFDRSDNTVIELGDQIGDRVVFTGTLNSFTNLFHVFNMQGSAGKWIEVTIYSRGLPSPGFRVRESFGSWLRRSLAGHSATPTRTMMMPGNDTLDLIVETSVSGLPVGGPFGDESWKYVGVVEVVQAPQARQWDIFGETLTGNLANPLDNLIEVEIPAGTQAILSLTGLDPDVENMVMEVWDTPTSFSQRHTLDESSNITIESGTFSSVYLHFDAQVLHGGRTDFAVTARQTMTLSPGQFIQEEISAQAGQLIRLSHINTGANSVAARVSFDNVEIYSNDALLAENKTSYAVGETRRGFMPAPEDGIYTVEYENTSSSDINGFYTTMSVQNVPIFEIDEQGSSEFEVAFPSQSLAIGDWQFVVIDAPSAVFIDASVTSGGGYPNVTIFNTAGDIVHNNNGSFLNNNTAIDLFEGGMYVLGIHSLYTWSTITGTINIELQGHPVTPIAPGDSIVETFNVETFDILQGSVSFRTGAAPDVRLLNPNGDVVFEMEEISTHVDILELFPGSGEFTLRIENNGEQATLDVAFDFNVMTPDEVRTRAGDFTEVISRGGLMEEGEREIYLIRSLTNLNNNIEAIVFGGDSTLDPEAITMRLWSFATGTVIASASADGTASLSDIVLSSGEYFLEVIADTDLNDGYTLDWSGVISQIFNVSISSAPGIPIPDSTPSGITDTITIPSCPSIIDIEVDINIPHTWRGDLIVILTSPTGQESTLHHRHGGSTNDVIGTYPYPSDSGLQSGEDLLDLEGTSGTGTWELFVSDNAGGDLGTLESWAIHLTCSS